MVQKSVDLSEIDRSLLLRGVPVSNFWKPWRKNDRTHPSRIIVCCGSKPLGIFRVEYVDFSREEDIDIFVTSALLPGPIIRIWLDRIEQEG